jgi:predicted RNase H-like nuclease
VTGRVVGGLDGCAGGWVLVTVAVAGSTAGSRAGSTDGSTTGRRLGVTVVETLDAVVADVRSGRMASAAIDIPIGLAARDPRACDLEARRLLGPRRSSVFPAPVRSVLGAATYAEACDRSRRACGKGISKQVFNIVPKIAEVDRLQSHRVQAHLFEMHPELSFSVLAGAPMRSAKRTAAGRVERIAALRPAFGDVARLVEHPPAGAQRDDVLDALVGAWTALRHAAQSHLRLGGQRDGRGLRMEMIA